MKPLPVSAQPKLLNELIESLAQAAGGASQLVHHMRDPRWMGIRDIIELVQGGVLEVATVSTKISIIKP